MYTLHICILYFLISIKFCFQFVIEFSYFYVFTCECFVYEMNKVFRVTYLPLLVIIELWSAVPTLAINTTKLMLTSFNIQPCFTGPSFDN